MQYGMTRYGLLTGLVFLGIASWAMAATTVPVPKQAVSVSSASGRCSVASVLTVARSGKSGPFYKLDRDTTLCPKTTYRLPLRITSPGVTLDCAGAILDGSQLSPKQYGMKTTGISARDVGDLTIKRCTIRNFPGSGINIQGMNTLSPDLLPKNVTISDTTVEDNGAVGVFVRITDSLLTRLTVRRNPLGIYLEHTTNNVTVSDSVITDSSAREGIAIDAAFQNKILNNQILNNASHGITLYKNCGEHNAKDPRNYVAGGNLIAGNTIRGHVRPVRLGQELSHDITPGTGIAVALRQGRSLKGQQINKKTGAVEACSDLRTYGLPENRHYDFAPGNIIQGNVIDGNTLGIYDANSNTQIIGNDFSNNGGNRWLDVFVGNVYLDMVKKPVTGVTLDQNKWASGKPVIKQRRATTGSLGQLGGSDGQFPDKPIDQRF